MTYPKFGAILFDLDGTLVDTGRPHEDAQIAMLKQFGIDGLADDHPETFGLGVELGVRLVADHYELDDFNAAYEEYCRQWDLQVEGGVDLMPGADSAVKSAVGYGVPIGLVTSGDERHTTEFLKSTGYTDLFSAVITEEKVKKLKPDPEPYLSAADLLNVNPKQCLVFEDSIAGITAAKAAGMTCVGIGSIAQSAEGKFAPDMSISSLAGFDIWNVRPF